VWPYELARRGVAVFVYDKRGTGASDGAPTSDFHLRARDTAAALKAAQGLAPGIRRVGVIGGSQGGWVAPLVGTLAPLDFVVAAFALADGPVAQDQAIVAEQLREAGFGADVQREARELTAITARIVTSTRFEGLEALDAFKARHAGAPWLGAIGPRSYTGLLLRIPSEQIRAAGPAMAQGLPFDHQPLPVLESIAPARRAGPAGAQRRHAGHTPPAPAARTPDRRGPVPPRRPRADRSPAAFGRPGRRLFGACVRPHGRLDPSSSNPGGGRVSCRGVCRCPLIKA
jgi:pimeloyl-ACP methyl ester carboxylesterase